MAHKMGAGSTKNNRDSLSKNLGIKIAQDAYVKSGRILVRQRGLHFLPGTNVNCGKDFTLYARSTGYVYYDTDTISPSCIVHINQY